MAKKGCSTCLYLNKANCNIYGEPCVNCSDDLDRFIPTTNGDRLRALSIMHNNELAELLTDIQRQTRRPPWEWKEWLEQKVVIDE